MNTSFRDAVLSSNVMGRTENGAVTYTTSMSMCLDLFFRIGALRETPLVALKVFEEAYREDREIAVRVALWGRDVRAGAGEREIFRTIFKWLENHDFDAFSRVAMRVSELGRWDDLLVASTTSGYNFVAELYAKALADGNGLAAKWAPRKGVAAVRLRNALGLAPKQYRKLVVGLTNVVETQMCSNNWSEINFEHVPSLASTRYRKAFYKKLPERYTHYVSAVNAGTAKVNTGAVYPYDVIKNLVSRDYYNTSKVDVAAMQGQWDNLPNWITEGNGIIPMIDVSGSMTSAISSSSFSLLPFSSFFLLIPSFPST